MEKIDILPQETLKRLQGTLLNILKDIDKVCKKHNLTYMLIAGTLLGAIRHKGFIPWDDDIDIAMPRDDYEKFIKICEDELSDYVIQTPYNTKNYFLPFSKLRLKNTLYDEAAVKHIDMFKGIFVDIFPIDNVEKNNFSLKLRALKVRTIRDALAYKFKINNKIMNFKYFYIVFFLRFLPVKWLLLYQQKVMKKCKNNQSNYLINFATDQVYRSELTKRENLLPVQEMKFEGNLFKVPNKSEEYLSQMYGDFMQLPPEDERVAHSPLKIVFDTRENK